MGEEGIWGKSFPIFLLLQFEFVLQFFLGIHIIPVRRLLLALFLFLSQTFDLHNHIMIPWDADNRDHHLITFILFSIPIAISFCCNSSWRCKQYHHPLLLVWLCRRRNSPLFIFLTVSQIRPGYFAFLGHHQFWSRSPSQPTTSGLKIWDRNTTESSMMRGWGVN